MLKPSARARLLAAGLLAAGLLAAVLLAAPPAPAQASDAPIALDDVTSVRLAQTPVFGLPDAITTTQVVLTPESGRVLYQEVRAQDGVVLAQAEATADAAAMDRLTPVLAALVPLDSAIDTGVMDGHDTAIEVTLAGGRVLRWGGLVAERYGPEAFRAACAVIGQICADAAPTACASAPR